MGSFHTERALRIPKAGLLEPPGDQPVLSSDELIADQRGDDQDDNPRRRGRQRRTEKVAAGQKSEATGCATGFRGDVGHNR